MLKRIQKIYTFNKEIDEEKLESIKIENDKIFKNSNIEYKLDIDSKIVGHRRTYSGDVEYNIYICVDENDEKEALELLEANDEINEEEFLNEILILPEELQVSIEEERVDKELEEEKAKRENKKYSLVVLFYFVLLLTAGIVGCVRQYYILGCLSILSAGLMIFAIYAK